MKKSFLLFFVILLFDIGLSQTFRISVVNLIETSAVLSSLEGEKIVRIDTSKGLDKFY
ncbi:MAG: hypothetical protein HXY49_09385 [Ignavibacteriaceae bacterium]|nr:hypothetical protein [Ignavibacteriaceae bacterium]